MQKHRIQHPVLLVAEGSDDYHFLCHLTEKRHVDDNVQVFQTDGRTKVGAYLRALRNQEGFDQVTGVGILQDADNDAVSAFERGRQALTSVGLAAPPKVGHVSNSSPKTGVFVVPPNEHMGELEDYCLQALPQTPLHSCAEKYLACLQENQSLHAKRSKIMLRTVLASMRNPGVPIGRAVGNGYIDASHSCFDGLIEFIRELKQ